MARLKARHLPHKVTIKRVESEGADGTTYDVSEDAHAYVEQKTKLLIDRRALSPTYNQEIVADTFIVILTEDDVLPGDFITVWVGTRREREAQVVTSSKFDYRGTPNHVEVWAA